MDKVSLVSGVPSMVTPDNIDVAYNPMTVYNPDGSSCPPAIDCCDPCNNCCDTSEKGVAGNLYVSTHGDLHKEWIVIFPGNYVKFDKPLYLLQKSETTVDIPILEVQE